uniref:Ribosomal protein S18 n=1 Tax=Balanophora reflexa TaxID=533299 RepID=A0A3S5XHK7_9MAGN
MYFFLKKKFNYIKINNKYINKKKYILSKKKNKLNFFNQKLITIIIKQYRILSII